MFTKHRSGLRCVNIIYRNTGGIVFPSVCRGIITIRISILYFIIIYKYTDGRTNNFVVAEDASRQNKKETRLYHYDNTRCSL